MPAKPGLTQIEKDKLAIDPNIDFRDIAARPFHDITPNEMGMFKWSGVYHQLQPGFFMLRLRLPGGTIEARQLERAAELAEKYGQGRLCITTRTVLQFHYLRMQDVYKVIEGMEDVGVLSQNACGDTTRNVVTCPLADVCPHEVTDTRKMIDRLANDDEIFNEQRNLPRKHKISVAGCGRACGQTLINCQGWYPVKRTNGQGEEKRKEIGWKFHAGGGLGPKPRMASAIFDWVPEDLVPAVAQASTEAYRRHGDRRNRYAARLKLVVESMGPRGYADCVLGIMKERGVSDDDLRRIELAESGDAEIGDDFLEGQSVIQQKNGRYAIRLCIERGEFWGKDARRFAEWTRRYADGRIIFTNRQNLILRDVSQERRDKLIGEIEAAGYSLEGLEHLPDAVACVGSTVCPLAVSDTPNVFRKILAELGSDETWWRRIGPLKLNMNGCPNSCAQHAAADIGLRGNRRWEEVGSDEGYSIFVGGSLEGAGHAADYVCDVVAAEVVPTLRKLLDYYLTERESEHERFGRFALRVGMDTLREMLGTTAQIEPVNMRNVSMQPIFAEALDEARRRRSESARHEPAAPRFGT